MAKHGNDDESVGVVVTAFVNGYIKKDGEGNRPIYGYNLNQSEEQKRVVKSLEDIMAGKDKVEFLIIVIVLSSLMHQWMRMLGSILRPSKGLLHPT